MRSSREPGSVAPIVRSRWAPIDAQSTPAERRSVFVSTAVMAAILAIVAGFAIYERLQLPPHRTLPPAFRPDVILVPLGDVPADRLASMPRDYLAEYGINLTVAAAMPLPIETYDAFRGQYVAQDLLASMLAAHPASANGGPIVIGITSADMYIRDVPWRFAFGWREEGRAAVVSAARMPQTRYSNKWALARKMLTREIGFLCFDLPATDNRYDLLYRNILSVSDLRRLSDHL